MENICQKDPRNMTRRRLAGRTNSGYTSGFLVPVCLDIPTLQSRAMCAISEPCQSLKSELLSYRFLRKVCVKAYVFFSKIHVSLEQYALHKPAWIFCKD